MMRLRSRLVGLALVVLLAPAVSGCAVFEPETPPSPPATPVLSGIRGTVDLGPTCEDATRASPCIEPYSARLIFLDENDDVVGEVVSGTDGSFALALPPGIYTIQPAPPENGDPFPVGQAISVVVGEEEYTEVGVDYDTGIR